MKLRQGQKKKIFASIMVFLYENLFWMDWPKITIFEGQEKKDFNEKYFLMESFFSQWISGEGQKKKQNSGPPVVFGVY